uniref:Uncharacterized protein n=1 Tax=Suricata suricatta TaxID=37032 RepID=A0A673UJU8_SURSU
MQQEESRVAKSRPFPYYCLERERKLLKREVGENTQDGTSGSWFKITIPFGGKYDKTWLANSIQNHCGVPFTPVDFHHIKKQAQFFVQDADIASALKGVSYKICDEENRKVCVGEMEQLKLTINKCYNVFQQALDLQSLLIASSCLPEDLMGQDIDIILNQRNCMAIVTVTLTLLHQKLLSLNLSNNQLYGLDGLSDIIQMVPRVKILNLSKNKLTLVWELNKMKGLKLEELWLEGNPFCDTFPDQSTYISAIKDCFPKLLSLGSEFSPPVTIDIDTPSLIKPCKESYKGSETLKSLFLQFLQQSSLCEYFKENRNMKKLKDACVQLLKHTKRDIMCSLGVLPKTQRDLSSFVVDMWFQMVSICFLPRAALESHRWVLFLLLKWKEALRVLFVPSLGPSLLPLPTIPGECYVVGRNACPNSGPGVWDHGDVDILVFSVLWKANR